MAIRYINLPHGPKKKKANKTRDTDETSQTVSVLAAAYVIFLLLWKYLQLEFYTGLFVEVYLSGVLQTSVF